MTRGSHRRGRARKAKAEPHADDGRICNPPQRDEHQRYSRYSGETGVASPQEDVDAMAEDSFPASDPPSFGGVTSGRPDRR